MKKIAINFIYLIILTISLSIIYFFFIFNPNNYKDKITDYISSKTKYEFTYNGDIEINFFPETKISMPNIEIYKELSTGSKNMIISIAKTELLISLDKLIDSIIDVKDITAKNFKYYGINADAVLLKTYSLLKFSLYDDLHPDITNIMNMSARANIDDKIMYINDIYIETEMMEAKGSGTINILTKVADIRMTGNIKELNKITNSYNKIYPDELNGEELPIIITGELNNLSVSIDLSQIAIKKIEPIKEKVIDAIKEKVFDELDDKIKLPF